MSTGKLIKLMCKENTAHARVRTTRQATRTACVLQWPPAARSSGSSGKDETAGEGNAMTEQELEVLRLKCQIVALQVPACVKRSALCR
jgi:hypothetical protein